MSKYTIRQAIINAMHEYRNPQNFNSLLCHQSVIFAAGHLKLTNEDIKDIRMAWNFLIEHEYLVVIPGYDDYCKLSSDIRGKLDAWDKLTAPNPLAKDEHLYGPGALS